MYYSIHSRNAKTVTNKKTGVNNTVYCTVKPRPQWRLYSRRERRLSRHCGRGWADSENILKHALKII